MSRRLLIPTGGCWVSKPNNNNSNNNSTYTHTHVCVWCWARQLFRVYHRLRLASCRQTSSTIIIRLKSRLWSFAGTRARLVDCTAVGRGPCVIIIGVYVVTWRRERELDNTQAVQLKYNDLLTRPNQHVSKHQRMENGIQTIGAIISRHFLPYLTLDIVFCTLWHVRRSIIINNKSTCVTQEM